MKAPKLSTLILFLIGSLCLSINAQNSLNIAKLDSLLNIYEQKNKLMLTLAISKNGKVEYSRAIGYSWYEGDQQIKSNTTTKFRIGSISKMFTSIMIQQLVEEKKLKMSTPLSKFFPKIANAKIITIDQMLRHRSGLHNFTDDPEYITYMTMPKSQTDMLDIFYKLKSDFDPGSKMEYSNTNYVLLGFIIEKLTKKTYANALKERIVDKIGLKNTCYANKADIQKNEARSYRFTGTKWMVDVETDMSIPHGAGCIESTPEDLIQFIEAVFSYKLISKESLDEMVRLVDNFGQGIFMMPFYDKMLLGHTGHIDMFESNLVFYGPEKLTVAFSANGINAITNDFLIGVLSICFNMNYDIPKFYSFDVPEEILKEYTGTYHSSMMKMDFYIVNEGAVITGQAPDQPSFPLEPKSQTIFNYDPAGVVIEFKRNISNQVDQLILKQSGMEFIFLKQK